MEKEIKIAEHLLEIQELVGKISFSKQEIINILKQVDSIIYNEDKTIENDYKKEFATKEQRVTFNDIVSKISGTKKSEDYPNSVFYMVGDSVYMKQDLKTDIFYISYDNFWSVFETKFNLKYKETSYLLRDLLVEHLNCKVNTTKNSLGPLKLNW